MTTLATARARYYDVNQFGADGGDALAWVPVKLGRITVKIPNTDGRRRAVRFHDLHHIVTGYETTVRGESEIAAWELASGCTRWPAATVLNLAGLAFGILVWPKRCARAWALGRRSRNFYGEDGVTHLLARDVDEVRAELGLAIVAGEGPGGGPGGPAGVRVRVRVRDVATMLGYVAAAPVLVALSLISARSRSRSERRSRRP